MARHAETELLYDRPYEDEHKIRVAGPFTLESLSPHRTAPRSGCASSALRRTRQVDLGRSGDEVFKVYDVG
jgi:adenine-specific DNA-methyltransferase